MGKITREDAERINGKIDKTFGITDEIKGDKGDVYAPSHASPSETQLTLHELRKQLETLYNESRQTGMLRVGSPINHMVDGSLALFTQALTSLKREMEKKKIPNHIKSAKVAMGGTLGGKTDYVVGIGDLTKEEHAHNQAISECQRVIDTKLKELK